MTKYRAWSQILTKEWNIEASEPKAKENTGCTASFRDSDFEEHWFTNRMMKICWESNLERTAWIVGEAEKTEMVRVATYFGMSLGAFVFWQSMEKVHVWIALHQDEKVLETPFPHFNFSSCFKSELYAHWNAFLFIFHS